MKLVLKSPNEILEDELIPFQPKVIEEELYKECIKIAKGNFLITSKYIIYLSLTEKKSITKYIALPIATNVEIVSCQQDLLSKERNYLVKIFNGKEYITRTFDSSILTSLGAKKLLQHGCVFDENNLKYLMQYLSWSAYNAPINYVHLGLGWNFDNEPIFLSGETISNFGIKSEYIGKLNLKPHGSLQEWLKMIKTEVIGNPALEFSLLIGFSAPILAYLNNYLDLGCFVFNFGNCSSKGKTTTAMLIASVFGNPSFEKGLVTTLNGTNNAIVSFVSQASGHPVVLDEVATGNRQTFRNLLYQICSGADRKRLNTDSQMKERNTFNCIVVTTAEFPIIDETASSGIKARVFELGFDLTNSAQQADYIKKIVCTNYGYAGRDFLRFVFNNKLNKIVEDYEKYYNMLIDIYDKRKLGFDNLTLRILSKLVVILITARYVKECFELDINITNIVRKIKEIEKSITNDSDISDKALDCIVQYISKNKFKFIIGRDGYNSSIEGMIEDANSDKRITILKSVVEKILIDNGFENLKLIYSEWAEKKILIKEKDRPYKRVRLTKELPIQPCFIFKIY